MEGMVLISDGNSEHIAHAQKKIDYCGEKKCRVVTALVLIKCLKQIKFQIFLLTCAPISELPSHISTMMEGGKSQPSVTKPCCKTVTHPNIYRKYKKNVSCLVHKHLNYKLFS